MKRIPWFWNPKHCSEDSISNYRLALLKWGRTRREDTVNSPLYEQDLQLCLSMVNQLKDFRSGRLSRESLILPPTFYWTFGFLSVFITISFGLREAADPDSEFSIVYRCFFSALTLAFLTLFRFAIDMNYPFKGPSCKTQCEVPAGFMLERSSCFFIPWLLPRMKCKRIEQEAQR